MQYAYPHKYTCTLDRCKQKERKKERKKEEKGKKTKGTRVFSAIHSNVVAMKKNLETIFGGEGKKKKRKSEKFTHVLYASVIYKNTNTDTIVGECLTVEHRATHSMTFTVDLQKTITAQSILPVFAFQCFTPSSMSTQRNNIRRISRIFDSLARTPEKSSIFFRTRIYETVRHTNHRSLFWALLDCLRCTQTITLI